MGTKRSRRRKKKQKKLSPEEYCARKAQYSQPYEAKIEAQRLNNQELSGAHFHIFLKCRYCNFWHTFRRKKF